MMTGYNNDPTPEFLDRNSYDAVFELMVNQPNVDWVWTRPAERSFTGNMKRFVLNHSPDLFLLTYKSAIPLADSVRGYYEELGLQMPELGVVDVKATGHYPFSTSIEPEVLEREVTKLRPLIEGKRVVILDQYINKRTTVTRSRDVADAAGATDVVTPDFANWYHDARLEDIDLRKLSSVHAEKMRQIGHAAAQLIEVDNDRIVT